MKPILMVEVIGGKRYDTDKADVVAGDDYWDGHNFERHGTQTFLFKTKNGNYFFLHMTQWQGQQDRLEPISQKEAVEAWERLPERRMAFEEAFPNVKIEEA